MTATTYTAYTTGITKTFTDVTWTPSNCTSTITYTALQTNGSALPSYISFTASNNTFYAYCPDRRTEGTYYIRVTATLSSLMY